MNKEIKETKFTVRTSQLPPGISDLITPVSIYLRIRDQFPNTILLESSDYHGNRNSMTYICFDVIANFRLDDDTITMSYPDGEIAEVKNAREAGLANYLNNFLNSFKDITKGGAPKKIANGLFGYTSFDAVQYFENISFKNPVSDDCRIPLVNYSFYRYILSINHFNNQLVLLENITDSNKTGTENIETILSNRSLGRFSFKAKNNEASNLSDNEFKEIVRQAKHHCRIGNVFQVVPSRQFSQEFSGDEFNVYRALRSINPSPYLFYFDYGGFKLFGSSPEAQLVIEDEVAHINPIAGTFKRSGDDEKDRELAIELSNDTKENAEHVMLVDLARNDLSRNSDEIKVKTYREVQFYSHVIHLVSEVTGKLEPGYNPIQVFGDCFPAGTLSGAPKYKAMELIDQFENRNRGYYGGALGYLGFNGEINHAIMIRSFLSKGNRLFYQAGAGVVDASVEENELKEVNNKLGALKQAIRQAEKI